MRETAMSGSKQRGKFAQVLHNSGTLAFVKAISRNRRRAHSIPAARNQERVPKAG